MIKVIPSIIAKSFEELEERVKKVEPYVDRVQIDIMDGIFVSNSTIANEEVDRLDTKLLLDIHLMVTKPENHIAQWFNPLADRILVHWESTDDLQKVINLVKDEEKKIGVVLNPETNIKVLANFVDQLDLIQFMTVIPGDYGGEFKKEVLDKIFDFNYFYPDILIQVDGSVNLETAPKIIEAGASSLVSGSYLFNSSNIKEAIKKLSEVK